MSWRSSRVTALRLVQREPVSRPIGRQLLLDVSNIARHDAGTGIQRVVRAMASALQSLALTETTVRLIAADRHNFYRYLPDAWLQRPDTATAPNLAELESVNAGAGDVFLGLDFCASIVRHHEERFAEWQSAGVKLNFFLYDLLPMSHGRWFTFRMRRNFRRWVSLVRSRADRVIAISQTVADEFELLQRRGTTRARRVQVTKARLGSNIAASLPSQGFPAHGPEVLAWMARRPTVLMVGTIEPRKGHEQATAAFDWLGRHHSSAPQLLIIGRAGWKTEKLQQDLRHRSKHGKILWLDSVSDEFLEQIYARSAGLLVASEGEGFGLPIVEAMSHGRPVLARDLPVFRELDGPGMSYFGSCAPKPLGEAVLEWLRQESIGVQLGRETISWHQAAENLAYLLGLYAQEVEVRTEPSMENGPVTHSVRATACQTRAMHR